MQIETRYGQYWDAQAVAQFSILPYFPPSEITRAEWVLNNRLAQLTAGRVASAYHRHVESYLQQLDPCLRLRWEFEHPDGGGMWAIDRYVAQYGYHFCLCYWSHTLGEGGAIRAILEDGDMQRPDYLQRKRKYQEYALLRNDTLRREIALAAVDQMTARQRQQMIDVELALAHGEKVRPYGRDAEICNKMYDNTKKLDAMLRDNLSDHLIEQVIGERVKVLDTDPSQVKVTLT